MGFLAAEIAFEQLAFGLGEVHDDQAIKDVGKFRVDVKSEQLSAQPQVLPQQDRNAGAIWLILRHHVGELVKITARGDLRWAGSAMARTDEMGPLLQLRGA